ncbi:hypothetical protein HDU99_003473 [Rhizoclosmatium hyalinum]|nr:hypothetical protein HDU99_003473 [Rhizoclosmatium hyalinum]
MKVAILFGSCASAVEPERAVLTAIASCCSSTEDESESVRMTGISRTGGSERGEFAVQQVLSLEVLSAMPKLPSANAVNALLPQSVRVFHITNIDKAFSARRMCESRTYEYLIPVC